MAYENYKMVTWADLTPITSVRLQQMSTNIEQVKEANDDKPKGVQRLRTISSNIAITSANALLESEIIYLKNEGNGTDNRITLETGRYYKLTLTFPGIAPSGAGGEDSIYYLNIKDGTFGGTNTSIASYRLSSGPLIFVNTATSTANVSSLSLNASARFGSGTYTYVLSGNGAQNVSFFAEVVKVQGASGSNNITGYTVVASEVPMQMFIEDAGGTV
jgi:hypothetical protein